MLISIHGSDLRKVAWIDNDKPHTLNYFDDVWTRYLETGSSIFEFTVYKKAVKSDLGDNRAYNLLNDKAFISFKYKGRSYVFSVMQIDEDETTMHCVCENLNLELINEYSNPYKASKAMTFSEYCKAMELLNFSLLQIGRNEVEEKKLTLEWEGTETKLARLLSLAVRFDAELEFETRLRYDSTIKSFLVHVYKSYDGVTNNGVGQIRSDVSLVYGKNLRKMTRKIDKTGIFNAVRATGKRENGEIVTIAGASEIEVKNSKGQVEFYQKGEMLYAPLSMQRYPSAFTSETTNDQWIRKDMIVESDNPTVIRSAALASLRKNAYPAITYELDGWVDADIGDTVKITDNGFTPTLIVQARVFEQSISFTKPSRNKTVFANAKALENQLSDDAQGAIKRMIEELQPYSIRLATTNGVMFKNGQGTSTVIPSLYRGIKQITGATWRYLVNGEGTQTGAEYVVNASSIGSRMVLTVCAYIGNTEVFRDNLTFTNVSDGKRGLDGRTPYVHFAYSDNADGTGLSMSDNGQRYIGHYSDYTQANSTDKSKYSWADRWANLEPAIKDVRAEIDKKADNNLTQEQLNLLNEKQSIIEQEMKAKAEAETLAQWMKSYNEFVEAEDDAKLSSEKKFQEMSARVDKIVEDYGEAVKRWKFVNGYVDVADEGIKLGREGDTTSILIQNNRISMISGGNTVMWISQGVIHIDNGVFTKTIQIGRFREEQYGATGVNADINVIRYVGPI